MKRMEDQFQNYACIIQNYECIHVTHKMTHIMFTLITIKRTKKKKKNYYESVISRQYTSLCLL